jgi:uncharacterized protein YndB with AHSA1/START domain
MNKLVNYIDMLNTTENTADREIVTTRLLDAPRELVFEVWTDPKHIAEWWGPNGFTNTIHEMEVKTGGIWRFMMHGPDGTDYPNRIVYSEVVRPERLVYSHDSDIDNDPRTFHVSVTFEEQAGKTLLTMRAIFSTAAVLAEVKKYGAVEGAQQTLARFAEHLKRRQASAIDNNQPFVIERIYEAPISKVWKAITDKDLMKQWYFDIPEFRPQVGMEFSFEGGPDDGIKYVHLCKVTEVIEGKKLTHSWRYKGYEGNSFVTWELFDEDGKTRVKLTHAGLETFPANNPDLAAHNFATGWTHIVGTGLADYLEASNRK